MFLDLTNDKAQERSFELIPDGKYIASIDRCSVETTKSGTGKYLKVSWKIQSEACNGRLVFTNYNFENPNQQAADIGRSEIKSFLQAAGATSFAIGTPSDLCGTCCEIVIRQKTDDHGAKNVIVGYNKIEGKAPQKGNSSSSEKSSGASSSTVPGL